MTESDRLVAVLLPRDWVLTELAGLPFAGGRLWSWRPLGRTVMGLEMAQMRMQRETMEELRGALREALAGELEPRLRRTAYRWACLSLSRALGGSL